MDEEFYDELSYKRIQKILNIFEKNYDLKKINRKRLIDSIQGLSFTSALSSGYFYLANSNNHLFDFDQGKIALSIMGGLSSIVGLMGLNQIYKRDLEKYNKIKKEINELNIEINTLETILTENE
jgi:hypothetical protein